MTRFSCRMARRGDRADETATKSPEINTNVPKQQSLQLENASDLDNGEAAQTDYEFFVGTGEASVIDAESRKTIRSHVMRNFFHQKKSATESQSSKRSRSTIRSKASLQGRFRLQKPPADQALVQLRTTNHGRTHDTDNVAKNILTLDNNDLQDHGPVELQKVSQGSTPQWAGSLTTVSLCDDYNNHRLDPFDTLPVDGSVRLETLLRYWRTVFKVNSIAINARPGGWFRFAYQDPAILHSTLCSVAMYCAIYHGLDPSFDIPYHKGKALSLLNERMSQPNLMLSDGVIGTIATLASFENLWGAYELSFSHLAGLRKLLALRGGLKALANNDTLQRAVTWAEYHIAAAFRTLPPFKFEPEPHLATLPDELMIEAASTSPNSLMKLPIHRHEVFNIYYQLHQLGLAFDANWIDRVNRRLASDLLHDVDFKLLSMPDYSGSLVENDKSIVEALTVTAQMFLYGALRSVPLAVRIYDIFLDRLILALQDRDTVLIWTSYCTLDVLLWAVSIGGVVAHDRRHLPWFIETLANIIPAAGIKTLKDYTSRLKGIAWTDDFCASACAGLWRCVLLMIPPTPEPEVPSFDPADESYEV